MQSEPSRLVCRGASSVGDVSGSCGSGGNGGNSGIRRSGQDDRGFGRKKASRGGVICDGDGGVTYSNCIFDILWGGTRAQDVSG